MISGIFFMTFRIFELIFLIPPLGMLSSIIHGYVSNNELAPAFVLVLFIVVVIATAWVVATMLGYSIAKHNGYFVALVDLLLFGGLIAGVAVLEPVNKTSCSNPDVRNSVYLLSGPFLYQFDNFCNLLKASFGLAIIDIILFFFTTLFALWLHHHHKNDRPRDQPTRQTEERRYHRSSRGRRDGSRSRSRPRDGYYDNRDARSRSRGGSRAPSQARYPAAQNYPQQEY